MQFTHRIPYNAWMINRQLLPTLAAALADYPAALRRMLDGAAFGKILVQVA